MTQFIIDNSDFFGMIFLLIGFFLWVGSISICFADFVVYNLPFRNIISKILCFVVGLIIFYWGNRLNTYSIALHFHTLYPHINFWDVNTYK